jgi:hypothetical protein
MSGNVSNAMKDKDTIIRFLEFEISSGRSEAKKPEWSKWAISGAISSLLWLGLSVIESSDDITFLNAILLVVLLSLFFDLYFIIKRIIISFDLEKGQDKKRFIKLGTEAIGFLIAISVRSAIILFLISLITSFMSNFVYYSCNVFVVTTLLTTSLSVPISIFKIAIPQKSNPKRKYKYFWYIQALLWIVSGLISVVGLSSILYKKQIILSVSDWKIGLICFGLSILMVLLFRSKPQANYLKLLEQIHKKVSLGNMDIKNAKTQIDIILYGLTLSNVLQPNISQVLDAQNSLLKIYDDFCSELAVIEKFIDTPKDQISDEDDKAVYAALKSSTEKPDQLENGINQITVRSDKLLFKFSLIAGMDRDSVPEMKKLFKVIDESKENIKKAFYILRKRLDSLKEKLGRGLGVTS